MVGRWTPRDTLVYSDAERDHTIETDTRAEMTMGQRVTGHGSSGSTNLSGSRGSRVSTRDPLTHDFVFRTL